ncbi:MAG: aryl-sulfate sulfotransferase [Planctomycetota bacterium]
MSSSFSPGRRSLGILVLATLTGAGAAQEPGHRLYQSGGSTNTQLLDRDGTIVHTWPGSFFPGLACYLKPNGNLVRTVSVGGIGGAGAGGGVQEVTLDGTLVWDFRYNTGGVTTHHDIEPMPNGNVLMIAWETRTRAEAIAAGRNTSRVSATMLPDHVIEVRPTGPTSGDIVWEWHVWDHLIQDFDATKANFGVVEDHPELIDLNYPLTTTRELNHCNSVDYDPFRDLVIISSRTQNEIWVIDHSTTTAEAAGHTGGTRGMGGDLIYRWGNPAAYGKTAPRTLFGQHSVKMVPEGYPGAGNLTIFNNQVTPRSTVYEIALPYDGQGGFTLGPSGVYGPSEPVWTFTLPGFSSSIMSSTERLPGGNTLICATTASRTIEVTPQGTIVFDERVGGGFGGGPFNVTYVERTNWAAADSLSTSAGGSAEYDLIAGSRYADDVYVMLGSLSGTSPGTPFAGKTIPLNLDAYMMATLTAPGSTLLPGSLGTLDGRGRATAALSLPAGLATALAGLTMHHAFVVLDGTSLRLERVSNAEALSLLP